MLPLRPSSRTLPDIRGRLRFFTLLVLLALALLTYRLWMLQILQGHRYAVLSESNRIRLERIPAVRGLVFDRRQRLLIHSRPSFDVRYMPAEGGDRLTPLRRLAHLLDADAAELVETARHGNGSEGVTLLRDVDWPTVVAVETHQLDLPGIHVSVKAQRSYLSDDMTAHLLGYLGEISAAQLQGLRRKGYRRGDAIGQAGLEKLWEEHLAGRSGGERVEVDAAGQKVRVIDRLEATPGHNVVLTLDMDVQQAAYDALKNREGAVVVLEVNTGAVLALVSTPAFDPNAFARGLKAREWRALADDGATPLHNRTLQGHFPPGSTFKIVTALAALQEGVISADQRLFCGGAYKVGNRVLRDWKKQGHGYVNMHQALVQSCDVYFYQVAQRLGVDKMAKWARRLGLGSPTGIALNGENPGLVPDRAWKRRRFGIPWYPGETPLVGIGQGFIGVTPLQLATLVAAVANGGAVYRPWFVQRVVSPDGEVMEQYGPVRTATVNLEKGHLEIVRRALSDVVHGRRGTARRARSDLVDIAGKTGTAQVAEMRGEAVRSEDLPYEIRDHAWFVAYAPTDKPEIAVATLVEHGGGGGATAAPITRKVVEAWFLSDDTEAEDVETTDAQLAALFAGRPHGAD